MTVLDALLFQFPTLVPLGNCQLQYLKDTLPNVEVSLVSVNDQSSQVDKRVHTCPDIEAPLRIW